MRVKSNKTIISISSLAIILAFFVLTSSVLAAEESGLKKATDGLETTAKQGFLGSTGGDLKTNIITDLPTGIGQIIGAVLAFVGIIFLVLMIYGGITWMTARGNEQAVAKAKDLITAAVIGLIIVLTAYAITSYIGVALTS